MPKKTVLVVEDEEAFVDALCVGLEAEGFRVEVARDGAEALTQFAQTNPDLILLDLMLPRISGIDVCRQIRAASSVPIIIVTAKSSEIDTVVGLEVGADDYITKPYRLRELVARMRAVLRRAEDRTRALAEADNAESVQSVVEVGELSLDEAQHEVRLRGDLVSLTLKEFELLSVLLANAGQVLPRDTIIDRVWGYDYVGDTKTLDVHIKRLRTKIEDSPSEPSRIVTIRGLGYKYQRVD